MELTAPEYRLSYLSVGAVVNGRTGFLVSPLPRFRVRTLLNGRRPNTYPSAAAAARRSPRMAKGAVMVGEPAAGGNGRRLSALHVRAKYAPIHGGTVWILAVLL